MNVAIILFEEKGGMVHYCSQLANALCQKMEIYVFLPGRTQATYFHRNVKLKTILISNSYFGRIPIASYTKLFKSLHKIRPDVIHITAAHIYNIPILPFLRKYPLIFTLHDPVVREKTNIVGIVHNNLFTRFSDIVIVHGANLKEQLVKKGIDGNKIRIIPHGDYSFFAKYKKDDVREENIILFFGRIESYKGLEYLIGAEPLITREIPNTKIIIAGRGNFSKYRKLIKNTKSFEIYNEFIPDKQVAELFQKAKIVVLPYIEASQSGIIPIAYAFKKPVVVTNVGCIPEVVDDGVTGFIVPPRDVNALANAIIKLLKDDELRKQMGENAYKKMIEELSWDKIAEKTIGVYKEVIGDKLCE